MLQQSQLNNQFHIIFVEAKNIRNNIIFFRTQIDFSLDEL